MMWGLLCAWMTESVATIGWEAVTPVEDLNLIIGWARADSYVYDLGMVVWCAWITKCVSKMGGGVVADNLARRDSP